MWRYRDLTFWAWFLSFTEGVTFSLPRRGLSLLYHGLYILACRGPLPRLGSSGSLLRRACRFARMAEEARANNHPGWALHSRVRELLLPVRHIHRAGTWVLLNKKG
jgi:hypothetical protein